MQEIRVGQVWQEKVKYGPRTMRVEEIGEVGRGGGTRKITLRLVSGQGRPTTVVQEYILRSSWSLVEEAPDAPLRQIRLTLAKDTTDKLCGGCSMRTEDGSGKTAYHFCEAFKDRCGYLSDRAERLPECVAAEGRE